jgi:hypothetical protein
MRFFSAPLTTLSIAALVVACAAPSGDEGDDSDLVEEEEVASTAQELGPCQTRRVWTRTGNGTSPPFCRFWEKRTSYRRLSRSCILGDPPRLSCAAEWELTCCRRL